ncbi:MAG TPA: sodium/solute symporter [Agriterribacter sp.]|nr:sodium/solute symporter [Agriterribacter sp.]
MKQFRHLFYWFCLVLAFPGYSAAQIQKQLKWEKLPAVPYGRPVSNALTGVIGDKLYVMGGRDADGSPCDDIYMLKSDKGWKLLGERLPGRIIVDHALSYKNSILLIGGYTNAGISKVYKLFELNGKLVVDSLRSPAVSLTGIAAAVINNYLFVAGEGTAHTMPRKNFIAYDLSGKNGDWIPLDVWEGASRSYAKTAIVNNELYLFGGIKKTAGNNGDTTYEHLRDAFKFSPEFRGSKLAGGKWKRIAAASGGISHAPSVLPVTGLSHILFPGAGNETPDSLLAYNKESNTWLNYGKLDVANGNGFSNAVHFKNGWVVPDKTTANTTGLAVYRLEKNLGFGIVNWITLAVYLAFMLWIGFATNKKGQTTSSFFTAGGKIPSWAAGLSIYGTQISAITFMAMPALVYATDWTLMIGSLLILATVPIVSRYYVPFFRRLSVTSAYEYLEHRFNRNVRLLGSISFILFQMGRMGIVLYLPAVAIAAVTGINIYLLIAIMGIICVVYTVLGGIEAVVWTDVAQVIILMGGAMLCLIVAIMNIEGGLGTVFTKGMEDHKFTLFRLGWSYSDTVLWVCVVCFFFLNIIPYTSDQSIVQRYLTVKDEKQAEKSLWVNAWITMPGTLFFFGLGTVLYVFYNQNPSVIASDKVDEILPYFVVQQLPVGLSGLVIAGIFAASQSTLSGSINSISASYFSDIYQRFNKNADAQTTLKVARLTTVMAGLFGTISAMLIVALDVRFAFDLFQEVLGILGGSLAGVFILGIFTNRANAAGVISGLIVGVAAVWWVRSNTTVSVYLYGAISVLACVLAGYLFSLLFPKPPGTEGLSYVSLKKLKNRK